MSRRTERIAAQLRQYLGPTAARAVMTLQPGARTIPIRSSSGFHIIELVAREPDFAPPLAKIRSQALVEYRRRRGDEALRNYLSELREGADIVLGRGIASGPK